MNEPKRWSELAGGASPEESEILLAGVSERMPSELRGQVWSAVTQRASADGGRRRRSPARGSISAPISPQSSRGRRAPIARQRMKAMVRQVLGASWLVLFGCARLEAEVGSDPPTDSTPKCDSTAALRAYYWNVRPDDPTDLIDFLIKVENRSGSAIPLATLSVRYYFRDELTTPTTLDVYYSDTCCSNKFSFDDRVRTSVQAVSSTRADSYFEIGFEPSVGELASGDAAQVEIGYHDAAFVATSTQSNDYSFLATATGTQADWDACPGPACLPTFTNCALTLYDAGVRVWGTPP
jgi:Cellulose binding domain